MPTSLAYTVVFCIPLLAASSMLSPTIHDLSIAVLLAISGWVIWQDPRQLRRPLLWLALTWMAFVLASAIWARAEALPGDPLRNWHKHIFIAIAPLITLSFAAALHRLQWHTDRLLLLFLGGLGGGASLLLLRNDAINMIAEFRSTEDLLGTMNRNLAALVCSLGIISLASLLSQFHRRPQLRLRMAWLPVSLLVIVLAGLVTLLGLLHSRAGYVSTAMASAVWLVVYLRCNHAGHVAAEHHRWPRLALIGTGIAALIFACYLALEFTGRPFIRGSFSAAPELLHQILNSQYDLAYTTARTFEARIQLLTLAADLFHQRPWLGWGPDAWHLPREFSPFDDLRALNQFHNGYAQFLVCFGIIGAALMAIYVAALLVAAIRRRRYAPNRLSPPLFATAMALLALLLTFNVSETVLLVKCAASTMMMLAALAALPLETVRSD